MADAGAAPSPLPVAELPVEPLPVEGDTEDVESVLLVSEFAPDRAGDSESIRIDAGVKPLAGRSFSNPEPARSSPPTDARADDLDAPFPWERE
jgi:hypothetical protein